MCAGSALGAESLSGESQFESMQNFLERLLSRTLFLFPSLRTYQEDTLRWQPAEPVGESLSNRRHFVSRFGQKFGSFDLLLKSESNSHQKFIAFYRRLSDSISERQVQQLLSKLWRMRLNLMKTHGETHKDSWKLI